MREGPGNTATGIRKLTHLALLIITIATLLGCAADHKYIGEWQDVKDPNRFAKIYRDGNALIWEDNEGKYPAKLENGQLKVSAGIAEVTVQHVDSSDHLIAAGSEFKRKESK